jgi:hypothetical protein
MDGQLFNPLIPAEYLALLGVAATAVAGLLAWRTAARCARPKRMLLTALRALAILLLVLLAANPGSWQRADRDTRHEAVVLVDRSASMAVRDAEDGSRWEAAVTLAEALRTAATAVLPVSVHSFAAELDEAPLSRPSHTSLLPPPDGPASDLVGAGRAILDRYRGSGRRLQGLLILSDARQTGGCEASELADRARAMDCPVSVVVLGREVAEPDLSLSLDRRQHIALPGQKVAVACTVVNAHLPGISPLLRLLDDKGSELRNLQPQLAEAGTHTVRFDVPELTPGYHTFHIEAPAWEGERRTDNNRASFAVLVPERKMRVFVAEGIPSWDTKFFLQLLRRLEFISVLSVSRVTSERFFEVSGDADHYEDSARAVFPDTREALAEYDLVLIGKGAEYFLNAARLDLLKEFVRDQGGCVLFFRGRSNQVAMPEVEALEPVRWGETVSRSVYLRPTRAAEDLGLFGELLPGADDALWRSLPAIRGTRPQAIPKDFATVLMTAESDDGTKGEPVLVGRRFGKGQVITMNADGLWQWDFFPVTEKARAIYATLWAQLLQWTASSSDFLPGQSWSLRLSETVVRAGQSVHATVTRRADGGSSDSVALRVFRAGQPVQSRQLQLLAGAIPTAGTSLRFDEPGDYRVELFEAAGDKPLGPTRTVSVRAAPDENTTHSADPAFAAELAKLSGGTVLTLPQAREWLTALHQRREATGLEQAHRTVWQARWNVWYVLATVAALLCVEWFIRKRSGLL